MYGGEDEDVRYAWPYHVVADGDRLYDVPSYGGLSDAGRDAVALSACDRAAKSLFGRGPHADDACAARGGGMSLRRGWSGCAMDAVGQNRPPPVGVNMPRIRRYSREAQRALWRTRLLRGVWIDRLAAADDELVRFVNRFHPVSGFHHVVRAWLGNRVQRAAARLAIRMANRLADQHTDFVRTMRFRRAITPTSDGIPIQTLAITRGNVHYLLHPWSRLNARATRQQFRRSVALFDGPRAVRWVFDGSRLGMGKRAMVDTIQRHLNRTGPGLGTEPDDRRWLAAVERFVVVL